MPTRDARGSKRKSSTSTLAPPLEELTPPPTPLWGGEDEQNKESGARRRNPHGIAPSDVDEAAKPTQAFQHHICMATGLLTADAVLEPADAYIDHYDKRFDEADNMEALMQTDCF
ncbi:hypothetical protein B0H14DRAFT_3481680 [Mycena olivaceomarginata]|nr:hypothetical protein B0H14DRAFT_3481680 [Mycena olivaceomarginata]